MNYALQRLAHLIQVKNELNRKRRRFYCIANNRVLVDYDDHHHMSYKWKYVKHKSFTKKFANTQYRLIQQQMKSMTPEMRELRKQCGASIIWGCSGNIQGIKISDKRYLLDHVSRLAELYHADKILLGD